MKILRELFLSTGVAALKSRFGTLTAGFEIMIKVEGIVDWHQVLGFLDDAITGYEYCDDDMPISHRILSVIGDRAKSKSYRPLMLFGIPPPSGSWYEWMVSM